MKILPNVGRIYFTEELGNINPAMPSSPAIVDETVQEFPSLASSYTGSAFTPNPAGNLIIFEVLGRTNSVIGTAVSLSIGGQSLVPIAFEQQQFHNFAAIFTVQVSALTPGAVTPVLDFGDDNVVCCAINIVQVSGADMVNPIGGFAAVATSTPGEYTASLATTAANSLVLSAAAERGAAPNPTLATDGGGALNTGASGQVQGFNQGSLGITYVTANEEIQDPRTVTHTYASDSGVESAARLIIEVLAPAVPTLTIANVSVAAVSDGQIGVTIDSQDAQNGDLISWEMQAVGGGPVLASGNTTWPGDAIEIVDGIARQSVELTVSVCNSDPFTSAPFTIDTTAPVLNGAGGTMDNSDIDWSVTSNEARGTIYAALRRASDGVLPASDIIGGTGNAVDTDTDDSPATDGSNGGTFAAPANGTYCVDMVQIDDFGNESTVISSSDIVTTTSGPVFTDDFSTYALNESIAAANPDYTVFVGVSPQVATGPVARSTGSYDGVVHATVLTGSGYHVQMTLQTFGFSHRLYLDFVDSNNAYYMDWNGADTWVLVRRENGSDTPFSFASTGINIAAGHILRLARDGNDLVVFRNIGAGFVELYRATDTTFQTGRGGFLLQGNGAISDFTMDES